MVRCGLNIWENLATPQVIIFRPIRDQRMTLRIQNKYTSIQVGPYKTVGHIGKLQLSFAGRWRQLSYLGGGSLVCVDASSSKDWVRPRSLSQAMPGSCPGSASSSKEEVVVPVLGQARVPDAGRVWVPEPGKVQVPVPGQAWVLWGPIGQKGHKAL